MLCINCLLIDLIDDTSPAYLKYLQENPLLKAEGYSGIDMFHDAFYSRLFDVHPVRIQ